MANSDLQPCRVRSLKKPHNSFEISRHIAARSSSVSLVCLTRHSARPAPRQPIASLPQKAFLVDCCHAIQNSCIIENLPIANLGNSMMEYQMSTNTAKSLRNALVSEQSSILSLSESFHHQRKYRLGHALREPRLISRSLPLKTKTLLLDQYESLFRNNSFIY